MAIIKCPECGHQISDKAPVCPSCGVQIAGKLTRCPQCGEIYFKDMSLCPNCHHATVNSNIVNNPTIQAQQSASKAQTTPVQQSIENETRSYSQGNVVPPTDNNGNGNTNNNKPQKKGHSVLIVSFVIALIVSAACLYFYNDAKNSKEKEAYEYAMKSNDPLVLQSYLDTYKDASETHRDSIQSHLNMLKTGDQDWTNAVVSGSKSALVDYLTKHPDSTHKAEAIHKMDSIDWTQYSAENTIEAYNAYLDEHSNGEHFDEAKEAIKKLNSKTIQPEEKAAINTIFRHFFQSINSKDENGLTSTVSTFLTSFLGKTDATKSDVATFLSKIYKDDITNMNWHINSDYKIDKKEVGDNEYEYSVQFSVEQNIDRTDPAKETEAKYRINAKVSPDGKISSFNMVKIVD